MPGKIDAAGWAPPRPSVPADARRALAVVIGGYGDVLSPTERRMLFLMRGHRVLSATMRVRLGILARVAINRTAEVSHG